MFTGIITSIGHVARLEKTGDWKIRIAGLVPTTGLSLGASVACSGVCLTVLDFADDWFDVEASGETLFRTTLSDWQEGTQINLERALAVGDELGGHIVSGHVDGLAELTHIQPVGDSHHLRFNAPAELAGFIAEKGSVALDGVSLTVNQVEDSFFDVNIISHTWAATTLGQRKAGDRLNIEVDMLARYVARHSAYQAQY